MTIETVSIGDRKRELRALLARIASQPSRDWSAERERVSVLRDMLAARFTSPPAKPA